MTLPVVFTANGQTGYNLTNSLRLRASATANLQRTPATTTSQTTWTWSGWVKRGSLGTVQYLFGTYPASGQSNSTWLEFGFDSSNILIVGGWTVRYLGTTQVFRDPSAWYHIVLAIDSTQATSSNRVKFYVNGVQITAFATNNAPSLNQTMGGVNSTVVHCIGNSFPLAGTNPFDGYLDEVNFIDGQALTPTSFGSFNALTGVWQPARYTGTYGTNGFYLPFTDNSALTTSSNVGLGRDFSGNGNYWTTNNISITAGATYDSMTDVPTLTNATTANYAVLNPLASRTVGTMQNGNLTWSKSDGNADNYCCASTMAIPSSGKWYWEITVTNGASGANSIGIIPSTSTLQQTSNVIVGDNGITANAFGYYSDGTKLTAASPAAYGNSFTTGDIIGVAVDTTSGKIWWSKNGTFQASGDPAAGTNAAFTTLSGSYYAASSVRFNGNRHDYNFGQRPFAYTPPTGFVALNTFNLPNSTIVAGNKQMDVNIYTGNGAVRSITNSGSIQPDFVWIKNRTSGAFWHQLYDVNRGALKALFSNDTSSESTYTDTLTAFTSTGFNLGTDATFNGGVNKSGDAYVAWQWKAGGTAVTNTAGSITSQVSANTSAGFSVVTFTSDGTTAGGTVGHGLGVAPSMVIYKGRNTADNWFTYHVSVGGSNAVFLNLTNASTATALFNSSTPTSSIIQFRQSNWGAGNVVAYCFAQIAGYSAFGSYTGNGSTDGPFVFTGFRPRFFMTKCTSSTSDWHMTDTARYPTNSSTSMGYLDANTSAAEGNFNTYDGLSNGFKIRDNGSQVNGSGATYIYMAFAENPFKNALAR